MAQLKVDQLEWKREKPNFLTAPKAPQYSSVYSQQQAYDPMAGYLAQLQAERQRQLDAQRAAAQQAYQTGMAQLGQGAEEAQKQAYITSQREENALPQQMQALGLSGGASESSLTGLKAAYGENLANIAAQKLKAQSELEQQLAGMESQLARDYSQGLISDYQTFLPKMGRTQGTTTKSVAPQYMSQAQNYLKTGGTALGLYESLKQQNISDNEIDLILQQLGL